MKPGATISVSEMLQMRESGMTNADIAKSLDISYQTVLRYIGKQPNNIEYQRIKAAPPKFADKPKVEEDEEACLVVKTKKVELEGLEGIKYSVGPDFIDIIYKEKVLSVETDKIDTLIAELKAIKRNLKDVKASNEVW